MELCSNCFKQIPKEYPFCPYCGCPTIEVGLKQCTSGHIIYETCRTCPFCSQITNLGKSCLQKETRHNHATEILPASPTEVIPPADRTVIEDRIDDQTRVEFTAVSDQTRIDDTTTLPTPSPLFFAWLVFIDDEGKPIHDIRLTLEKTLIGKGADADIRLNNDFASKLHALIYIEAGQFFINDLGSTNHTWLNEKKITKEKLNDGDRICIGHQPMMFKTVTRNS
ncbi:MAG: FHA domain-containing protein [Candidatus Omnitrophota bacterium]